MNLIKKIRFLLSHKQKKELLILTILLAIGLGFEMLGLGVLIPVVSILLTDDIATKFPALVPVLRFLGNPDKQHLVIIVMAFLVFIYLAKSTFLLFLSWRQSKFAADLSADLSKRLFAGYLYQPYAFHLDRNSSEFLRNIKDEIYQFTYVSQAVIALSLELSVIVGAVLMLFLVEPFGALMITLSFLLLAGVYYKLFQRRIFQWGQKRQVYDEQINKHLMHGFGGIKELKLTGRTGHFIELFKGVNNSKAVITTKQITLQQIPRLYLELLGVIGLAGLIISVTLQGKPLDTLIPVIGLFVAAAFRMIPSANRVMGFLQSIRYAQPVVDLLYDEFKMMDKVQPENVTDTHETVAKEFKDNIEVKDLSFKYPNASDNIFNRISLKINKGESIGIVGMSGAGKSTLVDLILGLLSPTDGQIMADGVNISHNIRNWQNQIGYVPQNVYLSDESLKQNIAFGIPKDKIDQEKIDLAVRAAQLVDFVNDQPEGLDTFVGERGVRISGGQRQRIGIARALYYVPGLLVFDEATSALDNKTETEVMEVINALKGSRTILIIAHRLSTIESCDKVFELSKGSVVQLR